MGILHLTTENFDDIVSSKPFVVVDFWAKWCGPCLAFEPTFEQVAAQYPNVTFAKVDIEAYPQLAEDFQIRSIPFLMIFRQEFAVFAESGVQTQESLTDLIEQALKISIEDLRKQLDKGSE